MTGQVSAGHAPGLVLALSRGGDVHVDGIGTASADGREPIRPDAIFRITSMTRPVTAVATLQLVQDGRLALDEPVDRLLPELAGRRVLRHLDGAVDDTVAADRPVTVRDLLTFRAGFGIILAPPDDYPILAAEQALELRSAGPPTPVTPHGPGEWLRRMGTLPLMDQPGQQWRYSTGSQILGVLIARAAGQPVESFYQERIFGPLGMDDTGFWVPAAQLHRLVPCYQEVGGALERFDDDGQWARPRAFPDCGAGLVSTAGDYLAFAQMLLAGGTHGGRRILAAELVAAMTVDQLTHTAARHGRPHPRRPRLGLRGFRHRPARQRRSRPPGVRLGRRLRHRVGHRPPGGPRRHPLHPGARVRRQPGGGGRVLVRRRPRARPLNHPAVMGREP